MRPRIQTHPTQTVHPPTKVNRIYDWELWALGPYTTSPNNNHANVPNKTHQNKLKNDLKAPPK